MWRATIARFSIRDVLWLTLALSLALGWYMHYRSLENRYAKRRDYIERLKDELRISIGAADFFHDMVAKDHPDGEFAFPHGRLPPELEQEPG